MATRGNIKLYSDASTVILQQGKETVLCTEGYEPWNGMKTAHEMVDEVDLGDGTFLYLYEGGKFCLTIVETQNVQDSSVDS
jgi:hypothetical protein